MPLMSFCFSYYFFHSAICIPSISHIDTTDEFSFPCDSFISEKNGKIPAESAFYKLVDQIGEGEGWMQIAGVNPEKPVCGCQECTGGLPEVGLKRTWFELFKSRCLKVPTPPDVPCMCAHVLLLPPYQQASCEGLQTYLWYQHYSWRLVLLPKPLLCFTVVASSPHADGEPVKLPQGAPALPSLCSGSQEHHGHTVWVKQLYNTEGLLMQPSP